MVKQPKSTGNGDGPKGPKSFTWHSNENTYNDNGVDTTTTTENQVLDDGTRIIKTTTKLKQHHVHGSTTVTDTNVQRIETVETEEAVVYGEDLTFMDLFLCCCPCFRPCLKKEEEEKEDGNGKNEATSAGNGDGAENEQITNNTGDSSTPKSVAKDWEKKCQDNKW